MDSTTNDRTDWKADRQGFSRPTLIQHESRACIQRPISPLATTSLMLALVGVIFWPVAKVAVIVGIIALFQIVTSKGTLGGLTRAVAGILIPAVMFSILVPLFGTLREMTRSESCYSNLKQLGSATQMYLQDYNDHFPLKQKWSDNLYPYLKSRPIFECPDFTRTETGYAYNKWLDRKSRDEIDNPSAAFEVFDARGMWNLSGGPALVDPSHQGGAHFLFADGHVRRLFPPGWANPASWNPLPPLRTQKLQ